MTNLKLPNTLAHDAKPVLSFHSQRTENYSIHTCWISDDYEPRWPSIIAYPTTTSGIIVYYGYDKPGLLTSNHYFK